MKVLSSEITRLLDKLYNLRGEDSVVLVSMEKEKQRAVETRDRTSVRKTELQNRINSLNSEENVLALEGEKLKNALAMIRKDEFSTVISSLNIDFDPEAIRRRVESMLPITLERVATEKKKCAEELIKVEDEMNDAITRISELGIRKEEAISNQERLNRYFELALDSNINITRDEITLLLSKFGFTEEEQREAAKLLMFPEDGLFEYESFARNRQMSFSRPIEVEPIKEEVKEHKYSFEQEGYTPYTMEEVKPQVVEFAPVDVAPVEETVLEEPISSIEPEVVVIETNNATEEVQNINEEPVVQEVSEEEINKEKLIEVLTSLGFDYLDFTNNDFEQMLANFNEELFRNSVKSVEDLGISKDIFVDNIELLYDKELEGKLEKLTTVGKLPQDIYLNPNVLIKYSLTELDSAIKTLHESGLEPKNVPLMAY